MSERSKPTEPSNPVRGRLSVGGVCVTHPTNRQPTVRYFESIQKPNSPIMRINSSRPSFDKPFYFDLVNNVRVIPMINATRFKLTNRAIGRAGLVKPAYLQPLIIIEAILKNDPAATEVAAALQRHLQDTAPGLVPAFKGAL